MITSQTDETWRVPVDSALKAIRVTFSHDGTSIVPLVYRTPAGLKAIDYQAIGYDLTQVFELCNLYCSTDESEDTVRTALYESALIRYRRCFSTGVRTSLGADAVSILTPTESNNHTYFLDMASKSIAHSVNSAETLLPVVIPGAGESGSPGWAFLNFRHTGESNDRVRRLGLLARLIREKVVQPRYDTFSNEYQQEVASLQDKDISKLQEAYMPVNSEANPKKRRI